MENELLLTRLPVERFGLQSSAGSSTPPELTRCERIDPHSWIAALVCLDVVGAIALAFVTFRMFAESVSFDRAQLWGCIGTFLVAWYLAAQSQRLYEPVLLSGRKMMFRAAATCSLAFGIVLLATFGFRLIGELARVWLFAWVAATLVWIIATRILWWRSTKAALRRGRCVHRAVVLACSESAARRAASALEMQSDRHVRVVGHGPLPGLAGGPSLDWIEESVRCGAVDRVVIADFGEAREETNTLLVRLSRLAIDVTLIPNFQGLFMPSMRVETIGLIPAVDVAIRPLSSGQALQKRIEDLCIAGLALLLLLPTFVLIALAIRLDSPGPVFFRQKRVGFHDSTFRVWKFRTMHHHLRDDGSVRQTSRGDPRVTRVGRLLRRTSLDELPQILNVLGGDMSIVGPRPHALQMTLGAVPLHETVEEYASRHRIKPGITGWAQVNGCRGEIATEAKLRQRIELDRYYIENWSLALDAWIILRTVALLVFDTDAY